MTIEQMLGRLQAQAKANPPKATPKTHKKVK
jgi:hypothetical protein